MNLFADKKCTPCEGGVNPYSQEQVQTYLTHIPDWQANADFTLITRTFKFKDFLQTMNFVNAIAFIAQKEMHHPDICVGYNYCTINYSTHAISGLSENDFICAEKINILTQDD